MHDERMCERIAREDVGSVYCSTFCKNERETLESRHREGQKGEPKTFEKRQVKLLRGISETRPGRVRDTPYRAGWKTTTRRVDTKKRKKKEKRFSLAFCFTTA